MLMRRRMVVMMFDVIMALFDVMMTMFDDEAYCEQNMIT